MIVAGLKSCLAGLLAGLIIESLSVRARLIIAPTERWVAHSAQVGQSGQWVHVKHSSSSSLPSLFIAESGNLDNILPSHAVVFHRMPQFIFD